MKFYLFIIISLLCCFDQAIADRSKQALKAIEKGDFDRAEEYLLRSYEKDSLNPLVFYAYAQLYLDTMYVHHSLDTAHGFVLRSVALLPYKTEDHEDEMDKAEVDSIGVVLLKQKVDSLGYLRATTQYTIESYQFFLDHFQGANEYADAVAGRDKMMFQKALNQNTWQSYQSFIRDYPSATQISLAQSRYDELIYLERAQKATTRQLEIFLLDEPNTPYRDELEQRVYLEKVSGMNVDSIYAFLERYDNDKLDKKSLAILYHIDALNLEKVKLEKQQLCQSFLDSVSRLEMLNREVLVPFLKNNQYTYHTLNGQQFLEETFDDINMEHLCGNVTDEILQVKDGDVSVLINRLGDEVFRGQIDGYKDLGSGLIAIHQEQLYGVIHKSGFEVLPMRYEAVDLLDDRLVSFVKDGFTGLAGVTGRLLLNSDYENIYLEGDFWIVEHDDVFALTNLNHILSEDSNKIDLKYEEVELINKRHIVGYTASYEELFDEQLKRITPDSTLSAITKNEAWVFRTEKGYYIYDQESESIFPTLYERVMQNEEWLGVYNGQNWSVYNRNVNQDPILNIDSVNLLGKDIAVVFRGENGVAIFPNKEVVEVKEGQYLQTLNPANRLDVHYLALGTNRGIALYEDAKLLFEYNCDEIGYISDSYFSVKKNGHFGAVDKTGRLIMRIRYDAISEAKDGVADILYNSKFGGYNFTDKILMRMEYDMRIERYSDGLYLVNEADQYGLLSSKNEILIEPIFDQIKYWSDSSFLGEQNGEWRVYGINSNASATQSFDGFEYVINSPEEVVIEVRVENKYGIYHGEKGFIVPPEFNDVINLGNIETPLYYGEKRFAEADIFIVVYYDENGEKIKSESYRGKEYDLIVCEN